MRKCYSLVWLLLSLIPIAGMAQGYQTAFVTGQGNPGGVTASDSETSGWTTAYSGAQTSNSYSDVIPIPFTFKFFGNTVTHLKAAPNGFVTFDTTATALPDNDAALPTATLPDQSIAAFWDDFQSTASGDIIRYKVFSTNTGNQLWIKWHSMTVGTASFAYFALVLEEGSSNIYVVDMWSSGASADARVGLQDDINTSVIADNNASLANNSSSVSNNEYWEFNPIVNGVDVRVLGVEVSDLAQNGCGGNMESVMVTVTNNGNQSTSGLLGTFSLNGALPTFFENIPGTLNPGDTLSYTFTQATADLSAIGSNSITGIVSAVGDVCIENDSLTLGVLTEAGLTVPIPTVDFSTYTSSNLPTAAPGWFEADGFGVPDSGSSSWIRDDFINDVNHPNGRSARINLFTDNREEWIVSPKITLGAQSFLRFDLALTDFSTGAVDNFGSDDYLEVLISNDCGVSYTPLMRYDSTSAVSNLGQTELISLSAYGGQDVIIGFFATDGSFDDNEDYNVYIDNIQVANPSLVEVGPTALSVSSSFCFSNMETVEANIQNFNPTALDFSVEPVIWVLDIAGPTNGSFTDTIETGTLASGSSLPLTLTNMADFAQSGTYDLTLYTSNPNDGDPTNDTTTLTVTVNNQVAPYFENFDGFTVSTGFNGGWERSNTSGFRWLVDNNSTTSSNTGPGQDHTSGSGNYVFTEATSGSQDDSTFLVSPCIDLSSIASPTMSFWYHMYGEDMGTLEALIFTSTDTTSVFSISGEQDTLEAPADPWNNQVVDLSAFAGQTVRVAFLGVKGVDFEGDMGVDDLFIFEATGKDVVALDGAVPSSACFIDVDSTVSYRLVNSANQLDLALDTVFVTITVQGPGGAQVITDTLGSGIFAAGDTLSSSAKFDFTAAGFYDVSLSVSLDGDQNPFNNDLGNLGQVQSIPIYGMPYAEDFDGFTPSVNDSDPGVIGDDWRRNRTEPLAWYPNDNGTPSSGTGPDDDNGGGGNYMYTEASSPAGAGDVAIFTTPCIDLSTSTTPALEFFYHLHGDDMGSLEVVARNRAGASQTVFFIFGEQQGDDSDAYTRVLANLSAFVGDTIEIDFIGTYGSGFEGDMAIDDVSVIEPSGTSVSMTAFTDLDECLGSADTLKVVVENLGGPLDLSMDTLFLAATVTGPTGAINLIDTLASGNLPTFGSVTFAFDQTVDFSAVGNYDVEANVTLDGDGDASDDTLLTTVAQLPLTSLPVGPVDFTGFTGTNLTSLFPGWYEATGELLPPDTTSNSDWDDDDFGNDPNSPNGTAARVNLFNVGTNAWLIGPRFTADSVSLLTFDLALTTFSGTNPANLGSDDFFVIGVSADCGNSYVPIKLFDAGTPISNIGQKEYIDLTGFDGEDLLVAFFATEGSIDDPGDVNVYVDNILVEQGDTLNGALVELVEPDGTTECGDSMSMGEVIVTNLGLSPLTNPSVSVSIDGPVTSTLLQASLNGTLAIGESDTISFGPFNTYEGGNFDITVALEQINDQDRSNDTLMASVFYRSVAPPSFMAVPDVCEGDSVTLMAADTLFPSTDFVWLASDGITQLGTGMSYNTGPLTDTSTFFLQRIATGGDGCTSDPAEITVDTRPLTMAGFAIDSTGDLFADFSDASLNADSVLYFFGDGDSSSMASPSHTYADTGTYVVQQIAFGFCGNDTSELSVTITCNLAVASFDATVLPDSNGVTVSFTSTAAGADSVKFDFGNNVTSTSDTTIDFQFTGEYTVTMVSFNLCGSDTTTQVLNLQNTSIAGALLESSVKLYPNPSDGEFFLSLSLQRQADLKVELLDARGRVVLSEAVGQRMGAVELKLNADELSEGLYLVKIQADEQSLIRKLRIE